MPIPCGRNDNRNLAAKLELRRHFIDKYHKAAATRVLDCCQGDGAIWAELRRQYHFARYWGIDVKPKRGRLKLASERLLALPGWEYEIVDIDTYGSPWKHWQAMLPHVKQPITVFLTIGYVEQITAKIDRESARALGIDQLKNVPPRLQMKVMHLAPRYALAAAFDHGLIFEEIAEADNKGGKARYLGVRMRPGTLPG